MAKLAGLGIFLLLTLQWMGSAAQAQQSPKPTIERIDIRGNRRIPEETIRFYIQSRPGDVFDESRLEFDFRALYRSNFFEDMEVQERDGDIGKIITFIVKEKPLIRSIEYTGNSSFTESDILEKFKEKKVGLTVDSQYDRAKLSAAERVLRDLLLQNGKPLGTVQAETESIPPSSVRVRFLIDEGPKVRIGKIKFIGNKVFRDGELKRALKLDKEHGMITMFKGTDKYFKDKLEADIEMNLKAFYMERGYMRILVGTPVVRIYEGPRGMVPLLRKTKQQFFIEIPIEAGDQYRLGKLELKNCTPLNCEVLVKAFGLKKGDVFNYTKVKNTLEEIKKFYGNLGYINFSHLNNYAMNPKDKTLDVSYDLQPDKQFYVHRIAFSGNSKTRDKVMRREFILEEGRAFSTAALDMSVMRLNQLGFFEKIEEKDYEVKPDDTAGTVDVGVKVKEKSLNSIGFTGGVSGISGSFIGLNFSTNNFRGRGENLEFSISAGTRSTDFIVSFTEPYLLDTRWSMGISLYNRRYRYDTYSAFGMADTSTGKAAELFSQRTTGTTLSLNRRLGRTAWSFGGSYTYQKIGIRNVAQGFESFALSQFVGSTPGNDPTAALTGIIRSEITPMISYNTTNSYFNPTRGSALNLSVAVSGGILGGDFSMIRPSIQFRYFHPDKWLSGGRNTFGFNFIGELIQAYGNSNIPFFDRFYIGGENTIRGFDIRSISPLAISSTKQLDLQGRPIIDLKTGLPAVTRNLISIGGDTLGILNFEYRIPIVGPLSMAAFYDMGATMVTRKSALVDYNAVHLDLISSTNTAVRGSTGVEVQFILPIVSAPFRLIFAYNPQIFDGTIKIGNNFLQMREPRKDVKFTIGRSF